MRPRRLAPTRRKRGTASCSRPRRALRSYWKLGANARGESPEWSPLETPGVGALGVFLFNSGAACLAASSTLAGLTPAPVLRSAGLSRSFLWPGRRSPYDVCCSWLPSCTTGDVRRRGGAARHSSGQGGSGNVHGRDHFLSTSAARLDVHPAGPLCRLSLRRRLLSLSSAPRTQQSLNFASRNAPSQAPPPGLDALDASLL
jgi:hypothetical protein